MEWHFELISFYINSLIKNFVFLRILDVAHFYMQNRQFEEVNKVLSLLFSVSCAIMSKALFHFGLSR